MKLKDIEEQINLILTNHLPHIQASQSKMETDIDWLKKITFVVLTAVVAGLIGQIISFIK